jgi:hypothetical protein
MPQRNNYSIKTSQVYYVRKAETGKCYRVFSPEQMIEMVESGRISEDDHVGLQVSNEGLGGSRGAE